MRFRHTLSQQFIFYFILMKYIFSFFVIFTCFTSILLAQDKSQVKFTVREVNNKRPLQDVACIIKRDSTIVNEYRSDVLGEVSFYLPDNETFRIIFNKEGYEPKKMDFDMSKLKGITLDLDVEMVKSNMYLFRGSLYNKNAEKFLPLMPVTIKNLYTGVEEKTHTDEVGLLYYYLQPFQKYEIRTESEVHLNKRAILNTDCGKNGEVKFCLSGFSFENFIDPDYEAKTITGTILLDSIRMNQTFRLDNVLYDVNSADLSVQSKERLDFLFQVLFDNPTIQVELRSHTDCRGDSASNRILSQKRADGCLNYLVGRGIRRSRLIAKGYGEMLTINECVDGVPCKEEDHQENRRTEFKVIGFVFPEGTVIGPKSAGKKEEEKAEEEK